MKLIIGLGNPGKEYQRTRHNSGFLAIDYLLSVYGFDQQKNEHQAITYITIINGEKVLFAKPQTFMNLSGLSFQSLRNFYKIPLEDILVIYDDKDFPLGHNQFRNQGRDGGHNGLKSIFQQLGKTELQRLRIGIGHPLDSQTLVSWVLGNYDHLELEKLLNSFKLLAPFIDDWTKGATFSKLMSFYNPLS